MSSPATSRASAATDSWTSAATAHGSSGNDVEIPADGEYTVTFRFANGTATARSAAVLVNGSSAGNVPFGSTGGWSTWKTNSLTVTLHQGTNKIRLKASTGAGGPLVDRVKVKGDRVILGKPAGTTRGAGLLQRQPWLQLREGGSKGRLCEDRAGGRGRCLGHARGVLR